MYSYRVSAENLPIYLEFDKQYFSDQEKLIMITNFEKLFMIRLNIMSSFPFRSRSLQDICTSWIWIYNEFLFLTISTFIFLKQWWKNTETIVIDIMMVMTNSIFQRIRFWIRFSDEFGGETYTYSKKMKDVMMSRLRYSTRSKWKIWWCFRYCSTIDWNENSR